MEQQHQNYESFGFINAAFTETADNNFSLDDVSKTNFTPDFQATNTSYNDPASLYNLPTEPIQSFSADNQHNNENDGENIAEEKSIHENSTADPDIKEIKEDASNVSQNNEEKAENVKPGGDITENIEKESEETTKPEESNENSNSSKVDTKIEHKKEVHGKKRRRIVLLSDEDSEEENLKNELLLDKSSDTEQQKDNQTEKSNELENFADESGSESDNKEMEGIVNRNFLKAKQLLKTAVVIEDPDKMKKKKKKRVLDSDDDENFLNTTVDDIGLINENESENVEDEIFTDDIVILNDIYDMPEDKNDEKSEDLSATDINTETTENQEKLSNEDPEKIKPDEHPVEQENQEVKTESSPKPDENIKQEDDVETILDKIEPMDDDDDFFKFNDSTDEEKNHVPNDEYFGAPDRKSKNTAIRGRKRGPKPGSRRSQNTTQKVRKRGDRYDKDFVDDSESSSSSESISSSLSSSSSSSDSSRERIRKPKPLPKQQPAPPVNKLIPIVETKTYTITKVPLIKKEPAKQDRFYDKSRNIPNDVYFGDVKVPLHVLHSRWNADEVSRARRAQQMAQKKNIPRVVSVPSTSKPSTPKVVPFVSKPPPQIAKPAKTEHEEEVKLNVMKEFMKIAGLKINYPKLFSNVKSTDHKCILLRRILNQKGVEGEPTLAKCRKLRRELQAKRESMELDKSVILQTEGRTRRSRRGIQSSDSNNEEKAPTVQPEVLQVLTKIKSVIDSDSE